MKVMIKESAIEGGDGVVVIITLDKFEVHEKENINHLYQNF